MHPDNLRHHLSTMTQSEIHELLIYEAKNANKLRKAKEKAEIAETASMCQKRKTAASWSYSERYEISKENLRIIVERLF